MLLELRGKSEPNSEIRVLGIGFRDSEALEDSLRAHVEIQMESMQRRRRSDSLGGGGWGTPHRGGSVATPSRRQRPVARPVAPRGHYDRTNYYAYLFLAVPQGSTPRPRLSRECLRPRKAPVRKALGLSMLHPAVGPDAAA